MICKKIKKNSKSFKREFRESFEKIINEDRILNKSEQNEINLLEEKFRFISQNINLKKKD